MVRLEVSLNGEVIATARSDQGVVHVDLEGGSSQKLWHTQINLRETKFRPASTGDDLAPKLRAALQYPERPPSVEWISSVVHQKLKLGDEITIRLIDVPEQPPSASADTLPHSS